MNEKLMEIAYERGLEVVETTQGMNGYPQGLGKAVIGFETFEEAQEVARESGGEVVLLTKRDGHQFWSNNGRQYEPIERAKFIDENNEEMFTNDLSFESWANEELCNKLKENPNMYDLQIMINDFCNAIDKITCMGDSEIAVVNKSDYDCSIYPKYSTHIHDDDVTTYMIAVVDHETDEDYAV